MSSGRDRRKRNKVKQQKRTGAKSEPEKKQKVPQDSQQVQEEQEKC